MLVKVLNKTHECYAREDYALNEALYEGGAKFDRIKDGLLRRREFETSGLPGGQKLRASRLAAAQYEPILAGLLDYLSSATLQEPVRIEAEGPEAKAAYYADLNREVGKLMQSRLLAAQLHKGSFIGIKFPVTPDEVQDLLTQRESGYLDAKLCPVDATSVLDWAEDEYGELEWAKIHTCRWDKSDPLAAKSTMLHSWVLLTPDEITEYEARQETNEAGQLIPFDDEATATETSRRPNPAGIVPLVKVDLPTYVIDRLRPVAISLFNRTSSLEYSLDASAYQQGILKTERNLQEIVIAESTLIKLREGEDLVYRGPDPQHLGQLATDCERLDRQLFKAIQAGALRTPSTDQNTSRLSGVARLREHGSIAVLLASYADALVQALEKAVNIIRIARGDAEVSITVAGADRFDTLDLDSDLNALQKLLALDIPVPDEAKRYIAREMVGSFTAKAPPAIRAEINRAFDKLPEQEEPEPEAPPQPPTGQPQAANQPPNPAGGQPTATK
ncbi:MAG TPA: hypothetical protein VGP72_10430 [Planctomycetota bacterium]|jgi:hypothetical protein